jgi:uncharacterized phage-associated protein
MLDSKTVANRFLDIARNAGDQLTPMQLLKLVYLAHGWMLGLYGRPLIKDEIQAWQYGPVIPRLYNALRDFRGGPVTEKLASTLNEGPSPTESSVIEQVYDLYGDKSGPALSRLTHAPGSPWALTYEPGSFGIVIPNDLIEDHYQRLANSHPAEP